jgi:hypothetical protein
MNLKSVNVIGSMNACMTVSNNGKNTISADGTICSYYCNAVEPEVLCKSNNDCAVLGNNYCCGLLMHKNTGFKLKP